MNRLETKPKIHTLKEFQTLAKARKKLKPGDCIELCDQWHSSGLLAHTDGIVFEMGDSTFLLNGTTTITKEAAITGAKAKPRKIHVSPRANGKFLNDEFRIPFEYTFMAAHPHGALFFTNDKKFVLILTD